MAIDIKKYFRNEYPRPQFERNQWENLNGLWSFAFDDNNLGEKEKWYKGKKFHKKINVPFTYETEASGIGDKEFHPYIWYQRDIVLDEDSVKNKEVILRFQRSDYLTKVWVNSKFVGEHRGGNAAFGFNITHELEVNKENSIVVKVEDSFDTAQPRGKQKWVNDNFGCWYTQTTGIWQTVWLEYLNPIHLDYTKITPNFDSNSVTIDYSLTPFQKEDVTVKTKVSYKGTEIRTLNYKTKRKEFQLTFDLIDDEFEWGVHVWSPENPNLYDLSFEVIVDNQLKDKVNSYFGLRKISISDGQVLLNNQPIYQKLLLDQGYWQESMLTPPSEEAIIEDIEKTIAMGFNGVRKHQKLEDNRFLYWCDKKGLLVWSEMAATYSFTDQAIDNFTKEWLDIIKENYNHPSIITWVPFNESWGVPNIKTEKDQQAFTQAIYYLTKSYDKERPVIVNDGWEHTISDIIALHDYEELGSVFKERYQDKDNIVENKIPHNGFKYAFADGFKYNGQPVIITEYGGIAFNEEQGWGYGNQVNNESEFLERYSNITDAIKNTPYIVGYCYTQTTDVQQEINGLLKADRTPKIALEKIKKINDSKPN
ncbi:glycoside hydrolase family 2 TIM barrel-domain containing protein [Alkalibacterium iburiense]|uniref:Glycoside hydrolase family 2 TIM barrel-domain containing protein n=1 Tax=Alkalibacterium iburiense TaxID=290589 RepID=A0ABN0XIY9_9LACT